MSNVNRDQALSLIEKVFFYYRKNKNNLQEINYSDGSTYGTFVSYTVKDNCLDKLIYKDPYKSIEVTTSYGNLSIYLCNRCSNVSSAFHYKWSSNWFIRKIDPVCRTFAKMEKEIVSMHKSKVKRENEIAKKEELRHFNQVYDELFPDIDNILLGEDKEEK